MKYKILQIICAIIISTGDAMAQSLSPFVVSSSGGFYSNSSGMLSFTTAEMTMVTTLTAGSSILTQGFQQPFDFSTNVAPVENSKYSMNVFPNPGDGNFNLAIVSKASVSARAAVYDAIGNLVWQKQLSLHEGRQIIALPLSELSEGIYMLEVVSSDPAQPVQSVQKIQIIK